MGDPVTHVHEAAHGWFGNGVRIQCWEDFVLSEGTVTYLAARAIGVVDGASAEQDTWDDYQQRLKSSVSAGDRLAWPSGCNNVDVLNLYQGGIPYYKGAFFYRAVEKIVGKAKLDQALSVFYKKYVGKAAGMKDMLDTIKTETGFDPTALAEQWLQSKGIP